MIKKEKIKVYETILNALKKDEYNGYGFCYITHHLCLAYFSNKNYPELFKLKPKKGYLYTTFIGVEHRYFWWKPGNNKIRIKATKSAIKSLKNQTND